METYYYTATFLLNDTTVSICFLGDIKDWIQVWHALRIADPLLINMSPTGCSVNPEKINDDNKRYIKSVIKYFSKDDCDLDIIDKW